jgi:UDP-N-acetylmuramate dehydrogenase
MGQKNITVKDISEAVIDTRKEKLPDYNIYPNCGSFFKNPVIKKKDLELLKSKYPSIHYFAFQKNYKIPAAWLIENIAKMKGKKVNGVGTWHSQPLVLVNYENKTIRELNRLIKIIKSKIKSQTGIELEQEVNYVN